MKTYYDADVWSKADTHIPATLTGKPVYFEKEYVQNMPIIEVRDAYYRNVHISHGYFVISPFEITRHFNVAKKIAVLCRWFDRRLKATGIRLLVDSSKVTFYPSLSIDVISDIHD
jgi:hypothetical protein